MIFFYLVQSNDDPQSTTLMAQGVKFDAREGPVVLSWLAEAQGVGIYQSIDSVIDMHVHQSEMDLRIDDEDRPYFEIIRETRDRRPLVARGVQFQDGKAAFRWHNETDRAVQLFDHIDHVRAFADRRDTLNLIKCGPTDSEESS